ncbi:MAG: class I SAM-dependent methyltransferase [Actinomycetota bacterium]|nr:class I SAM-dependent methyltransferase [Actinomycetota bacterium]
MTVLGTPQPEGNGGIDLAACLDRLVPPISEAAYEKAAGYGFARQQVPGKRVADLCWDETGHGARLLAETAESVASMAVSSEAAEVAAKALSAPNVRYEVMDLSGLSYPDGHFDVVVALGLIEHLDHPEELVAEARRVLKEDGVLVVSFPGGRTSDGSGTRGMLDRHFDQVRAYRVGAVSGGVVFPDAGEFGDGALLESISFSPAAPRPGMGPPAAASVVAVCGGTGLGEGDEKPYLLLDRDRRIFDECANRAEDVEGLRDEIEIMQRTEVQAFRDAIKLRDSEVSYLRARVRGAEAHVQRAEAHVQRAEARIQRLQIHTQNMERSKIWRLFEPYRRLRVRIEALRRFTPGGKKGNEDRG